MALKLGYLIWDSANGVACADKKAAVVCDVNARPASITPMLFDGVSGLQWYFNDNLSEWEGVTGERTGIAVEVDGVIYVWDVQGDATSDEAENSPFAKLSTFLELCKDCEDCEAAGVSTLDGEYEGEYPALPASSYCYTITVTGVTDYPTAQDIKVVEMNLGNYLVGAVKVQSYNAGSDTAVYLACLTISVGTKGQPMGAPSTYTFAAV
jgi:hypothetical protein